MVPLLSPCALIAKDSIPAQGTKIPQGVRHSQREKEQKNTHRGLREAEDEETESFRPNRNEERFAGGPVVKTTPTNAGDAGSIRDSGRPLTPRSSYRSCAPGPTSHNC